VKRSQPGFNANDLKAFGVRLRNLREQRQWSLKRLAQESSISVAAIRKVELGQSNPSILTILSLVEALGESIDRLIASAREGDTRVTVTRGNQALDVQKDEVDCTRHLIEPSMQCRIVSIGDAFPPPKPENENQAFGYVLDGSVSLAGGAPCRKGDAFHVSSLSDTPPTLSGGRRASLLLVTASPKIGSEDRVVLEQHD
jgi:transcriptional regulator with XRE-family HTH domain